MKNYGPKLEILLGYLTSNSDNNDEIYMKIKFNWYDGSSLTS